MSVAAKRSSSLLALIAAEASGRENRAAALIKFLIGLWRGTDRYDEDRVLAAAARSSSAVEGVARAQWMASSAYLQQTMRLYGISPKKVEALPQVGYYPRTAPVLDVYMRPAEQYRYVRSVGGQVVESDHGGARVIDANQAFTDRLESLARMDTLAASRDAIGPTLAGQRAVIGYRRVVHPELSRDGTCGLCIVASDRLYGKEHLKELHDRCHCTVAPVTLDEDPGLDLNRADLDKLYAAARTSRAEALKRTRIQTVDNGELGPILMEGGRNFRSAKQTAKLYRTKGVDSAGLPTSLTPNDFDAHQIDVLSRSLANLRKRAAAGEDLARPIKWQSDRIAVLRARTGRAAA